MPQDVGLQGDCLGGWVQAQLVGKQAAHASQRGQRFGLPPGAIQRERHGSPAALAQRVRRHEPAALDDRGLGIPGGQRRLHQ